MQEGMNEFSDFINIEWVPKNHNQVFVAETIFVSLEVYDYAFRGCRFDFGGGRALRVDGSRDEVGLGLCGASGEQQAEGHDKDFDFIYHTFRPSFLGKPKS